MLPRAYSWLYKEPGPRILLEAIKLYGVKEVPGTGDNPEILSWAQELGGVSSNYYKKDAQAWCALFISICAKRSKLSIPQGYDALRAMSWCKWGTLSDKPCLGDVLVFIRKGGGHVGLYVGEDRQAYHILGGNQQDQVNISRLDKKRLHMARRTPWLYAQPTNIRPIIFDSSLTNLSTNEE